MSGTATVVAPCGASRSATFCAHSPPRGTSTRQPASAPPADGTGAPDGLGAPGDVAARSPCASCPPRAAATRSAAPSASSDLATRAPSARAAASAGVVSPGLRGSDASAGSRRVGQVGRVRRQRDPPGLDQAPRPVRGAHDRIQHQHVPVHPAQRPHRRRAPGLERGQQRPLGDHREPGGTVVERRERRLRRGVERPAASTASAPCAGAGRTVAGIQRLGHRVQQAQPRQSRHREDDGVEVARVVVPRTLVARHPAEPGRHVPAQVHDLQVGTGREQLGGAPRRPGAHPCARRQRRQGESVACAQRVARVGALGHGDQAQALGRRGGQVLHRVHGQVALPGQQGLAQRGDEDAGPAERRERPGEPVAVGADPDELDRLPRARPERSRRARRRPCRSG